MDDFRGGIEEFTTYATMSFLLQFGVIACALLVATWNGAGFYTWVFAKTRFQKVTITKSKIDVLVNSAQLKSDGRGSGEAMMVNSLENKEENEDLEVGDKERSE